MRKWKFLFSTLCHSWAIIGKSLLFPACDKISILLRCGSRWNWRSPFFGLQKHNFLQKAMLGEQKTVLLAIVGWYTKVSTQGCFLEEMAKDLSSGIATYLKSNLAENKRVHCEERPKVSIYKNYKSISISTFMHNYNKILSASSGNRTRAARVAGEHSTTEPTMLIHQDEERFRYVSNNK